MAVETPYLQDGFQVVNKGVHGGIPPNTLERNQISFATNTTFRGGFPRSRPAWKKVDLQFMGSDGLVDSTLQDLFEDNRFQGATAFQRRNQIIASIGGSLFAIHLDDKSVRDISISGDLDNPNLRRAWLVEAEDFVIRQDGRAAALIYDGSSSRRAESDGVLEVPTGTVMAYSQGRLWVVLPEGRSFAAGDLVYGPSGTQQYSRRDAILKFSENTFLNGGGEFAVPINAGSITAIAPIAQLDTSQGQGPMQVFTTNGAFSINAPVVRTEWQNLEFPIQTVSLVSGGATSDRATINVNGDIWFRSNDGIRSFAVARREFGTWVNSPLSKEVENVISEDSPHLLGWASAALFDQRLWMTAQPYVDWTHGTLARGWVVLDFNPVSSLSGAANPNWEGAASAFPCLQILSGIFNDVERCFAFGLNSSNNIELWELTKNEDFDDDGSNKKRIVWVTYGAAYNFEDKGFAMKQLESGDFWADEMSGTVDFNIDYRPDTDAAWQDWTTKTVITGRESCLTAGQCTALDTLRKQYRTRQPLPKPADTCDTVTDKPYRRGFEFQTKLTVTGAARLKRFRLFASKVPESAEGECPEDETATTDLSVCPDDLFDYDIETASNA